MKDIMILATHAVQDRLLSAIRHTGMAVSVQCIENKQGLETAVSTPHHLIISEPCLGAFELTAEAMLAMRKRPSPVNIIWLRAANGCPPAMLLQADITCYLHPQADNEELTLVLKHQFTLQTAPIPPPPTPTAFNAHQISAAFASITDLLQLNEIFQITCQVAVELFQVDHSSLIIFDKTTRAGHIVAEFPDCGLLGQHISAKAGEQGSLHAIAGPLYIPNIHTANILGATQAAFQQLGIDAAMLIPIIVNGEIYAALSLDLMGQQRLFEQHDISLCQMFANQVSQAVGRAMQRQEINLNSHLPQKTSTANQTDQSHLTHTIVSQAIKMLDAQGGGLYHYDHQSNTLELIADIRPKISLKGITLTVGEGAAGHLVATEESFLIIPDYENWTNPAPVYQGKRFFGSVVEVPLRYAGQIIGVLFVDDVVGRKFTQQDAHLLQYFADQAAAAWHHARMAALDARRVHRLEALTRASADIMAELGKLPLDDLLNKIARHAAEVLDAEASSILLVQRPGILTFSAGYGYSKDKLPRGKEFAIQSGKGTGLTGHIAYEGTLFNAHGEALRHHPAVRGVEKPSAASGSCHAILVIPLQRKVDDNHQLVGLLRVENKKDLSGQVRADLPFTKQDEWILQLLAEAILIALDNVTTVSELDMQKDQLTRLLQAAPTAVIANDENGRIFFANARAEQILGRLEAELLQTPVLEIYADKSTPLEIGRQLNTQQDTVAGFNVLLRHKDGSTCPVRLTATRLYDAQGDNIGTVGYFEDLSTIHETRRQLEWLLTANNELAQAGTLATGLQRLGERIAQLKPVQLCTLWTLAPDKQTLELHAIAPKTKLDTTSDSQIWTPLPLSNYPIIANLLQNNEAAEFLFQINHPGCESLNQHLSIATKPNTDHPGLLLPLRLSDNVVGIIFITLTPNWNADPHANDFMHLIVSIAEQTALLIDRLMTLEHTQRRERLLSALNEATQVIRAERSPTQLWREMVRLAVELTGCTAGGLFLNSPMLNELNLVAVYELPEELLGTRLKYGDGLVGKAAAEEQLVYTNQYQEWHRPNSILAQFPFETVVAMPLQAQAGGNVSAVLMIADEEKWHYVTETELSILERFAAQAAVTLHTANLIDSEQRAFDHLSLLYRISNYVQTTDSLPDILHLFLTGITAGYGLGFNCAGILLVDSPHKWLVGEAGIGNIDREAASTAWQESHEAGLDHFDAYQQLLEFHNLPSTPIGKRLAQVAFPLEQGSQNPFNTVIENRKCILLDPQEFYTLPPSFYEAYQPASALILAPLIVRDRAIGVLVADNRFTQIQITRWSLDLVMTFASSAAIAIDKTRLLLETRAAKGRFKAFYEASQSLVSTAEPAAVLQQIAQKAQEVAQAVWVNLILIDQPGHLQRMVQSHQEGFVPPDLTIREQGLSMTIMRTGEEIVIDALGKTNYSVHPHTLSKKIEAVAGFPLTIRGYRVGVMWIHYDVPHHFSFTELEALRLFVNQAALAYDNALRLRELDRMRKADQDLAGATSLEMVLNGITENALYVLGADSAAVWSFDEERDLFLLQAWTGDASNSRIWDLFQHQPPSAGGMAYRVMIDGWRGVDSVADEADREILSLETRQRLMEIDVASFQAVALNVGQEKLGVLYVNYGLPHTFTDREEKAARTFAVHCALALKKVKLLEGFKRARDAAQAVARMTALESLETTLVEVLRGTKAALNCDAITLYRYDALSKHLFPYPITLGIQNEAAVSQLAEIPANSIIYQILQQQEMVIAEDTPNDPLFKKSRFTIQEGIATCVALPLRVNKETVGALFVNYRTRHRFTSNELDNIRLFGNQAAVAINNAQLYQREQSRSRALKALYEASQTVAVSLNLEEILTRIIEQAWHLIRFQDQKASYASIWLVENETNARLVATYPPEAYAQTKEKVGSLINWQTGVDGRVGIIGRVIQTRQTKLVSDVRESKHYLEAQTTTRSELAVPIMGQHGVAGVINLEHEAIDAFNKENIDGVEGLAAQAAIAIRNSKLFDQAVIHARLLDAAAQVASHAITILDEDKLLNETADLITTQLEFYHTAVFLLENGGRVAKLRAASSQGGKLMIANNHQLLVGEGIVGTVAERGTPYLAEDIAQDYHHLPNPLLPLTRAELAFPLIARGEVIGVLNVQSQQVLKVEAEEVSALQTMANQLANAIQNARYYTEVTRRAGALLALQEAGQAISSSLDLKEVLNHIVEQAWRLTGNYGPTAQFSCLTLVNEAGTHLAFEAAYPHETLEKLYTAVGDIDLRQSKRYGIMGRALHQKAPQLVSDVSNDPNYLQFAPNIRAELAVPIILNDVVIGVINVEHPEVNAFDAGDMHSLATLAAQAAVAIAKAAQYKELQRTHRMVEARTAVAVMGMTSSIWGHDITSHSQVIMEQISLLEDDLQMLGLTPEQYQHRLEMIIHSAETIRKKPLTLPLRTEETMTAVAVNDLVGERARQRWQNSPHRETALALEFELADKETILVSAEWLRRVLDILLDNAVEAMQTVPEKRVTIHTRSRGGFVEIAVIDTGPGLPPEIHKKIGIEYIERPEDAKGLGMGLLMAQIIVQAYDGQLKVGYTGPSGTSIVIVLPRHMEKR